MSSYYKIGQLKEISQVISNPGDITHSEFIQSASASFNSNLYNDITSIENWYNYGDVICTDWLQVRSRIIEDLDEKGWSNCSNLEKDIIIKLFIKQTNVTHSTMNYYKIVYLMSVKGMSQAEAIDFLQDSYAHFHTLEIVACLRRSQSKKVFKVIAKYLAIQDAADFTKVISVPYHLFTTQAIRGVDDGEAGVGLFDFIESTPGTIYETSGLRQQGYIMANGDLTMDNFINELMDILREGNY